MIKDEISIIKQYVDLESYSSSQGFIGYCRSNTGTDGNICWSIIDLLFNIFPQLTDEVFVVSSLHFDQESLEEDYEISKEEYNEYFVPLIKNKILKKIDVPFEDIDYESPEYDKKLEELEKTFICLENLDKKILKKVFFTVMVLDGVFGHCFLLLKKDGLIIYPHDEWGFGFISIRDDYKETKLFLKKAFCHKDFTVEM